MSAGRKHPPAWFTRWYFRSLIARDRCPCAWAGKSRLLQKSQLFSWLSYWCGRMDDEYDRLRLADCADFYLGQTANTSSGSAITLRWRWRRSHGAGAADRTPE